MIKNFQSKFGSPKNSKLKSLGAKPTCTITSHTETQHMFIQRQKQSNQKHVPEYSGNDTFPQGKHIDIVTNAKRTAKKNKETATQLQKDFKKHIQNK